jgi:hypothetical protein
MDWNLSDVLMEIQMLAIETPVGPGMWHLLDYCERRHDNELWETLRHLDFEGDAARLCAWFEKLLRREPPREDVNAYWFGVYHPVVEDSERSCALYVSGSTEYDPWDEHADWALWRGTSYLPEGRYVASDVLHIMYRRLQLYPEMLPAAEHALCLGYASLVVRQMMEVVSIDLLLGARENRAFVVGFDDGDFVDIGRLHQDLDWDEDEDLNWDENQEPDWDEDDDWW